MLKFIDEKGMEHLAQAEINVTNGVNGERSISGIIFSNDSAIHSIGRGWKLVHEDEFYCLTYALPVDEGEDVYVEFDAVHEFFYDFQKSVIHKELNGSHTFDAYLKFIFDGTEYKYRVETNIAAFEKESFGFKNRWSLFKDIIESVGVEFVVNGKVVRILKRVGTDLSTVVKKGFNLQELKLEHDIGSFITCKKGYGAYFDNDDESKGRLEVEYLSPLAELFGKLEGDPIIDERYTVKESLLSRLKNDVDNSYSIAISLTMEDLNQAGYKQDRPVAGDYIMAINDDIGFRQRVRIVSFTSSYDVDGNLIEHQIDCNSLSMSKISYFTEDNWRKEIESGLENALKDINHALISADGKNLIFYGLFGENSEGEPKAVNVGDMWYKPVGEETVFYIWDGKSWLELMSTVDNKIIKEELEQMEIEVQEAKDKADEVAVGLVEVQKDADEAKASAEQSKIDASEAMQDALTALNNSKETQSSLSDLTVKVDENTSELETKASKQELNQLDGTVKNQQTQITQNTNEIKTKASQSEVDTLKGTVTNQQTQINQNSENIKLKAEKSEVKNIQTELGNIDGRNLIISNGVREKWTIWGDGSQSADPHIFTTWYIDIGSAEYFSTTQPAFDGTHSRYSFYDSDKNFINRVVLSGKTRNTLEVPKGVKFVRWSPNAENGVYGEYFMLEKGQRHSTWSLAPEDLASQSEVTSLSSSIDIQANQIKNLVTKTDGHSTQLANLTIEADRISSQVVDLQNEEIGTDNLLLNSDFVDELNKWEWTKDGKMLPEVTDLLPAETKIVPSGKTLLIPTKDRDGLGGKIYQKVDTDFVKRSEKFTFSLYYADRANDYSVFKVYLLAKYNSSKSDKEFGNKNEIRSQQEFNRYVETVEVDTDNLKELHFVIETKLAYSVTRGQLLIQAPMLVVGSKTGDWGQGNETTYSQITQLSDDILLRVQKGDVINQINISTEGILIDGAKTHITGKTTIDNAVIKNAMIDSMTASKLTAGTIDANKINVINLNANNIATGTLNGIYINLDKTMTIAENGAINSSYNYGDEYGNSYNARWFDGTSRYGNRYINFLSNVYDVKSNNARGEFRYYSETFFGSDILKMRQYSSASNNIPIAHLDITADRLIAGKMWETDVSIDFWSGKLWSRNISADHMKSGFAEFLNGAQTRGDYGLETGRINTLSNYNTLQINNERTDLGDFELSKDSSGRRVQSAAIYYRTYGGGATVTVTDVGTLGRITSAAKYKLDIEDADTVIDNAFKVLEINPRMWFDKAEVESIAEAMTNDELQELETDRKIRRHHGFVADEFHEKGLDEVVIYDSKGEIEGLSYDRISMYHNVILKRQQDEIETLKRQVAELIGGD
ncbi:phage tail protein [Vagococcus lutrae]|uniref:phage tail protein n=1 Tax=Vagococcus lutrae TaxID=81947 RepID=UPI00288E5082|nr:phage tail protein [Vagococcus lutrae]MDT2816279.1 phage tail protein [Vagococcus lutrae]